MKNLITAEEFTARTGIVVRALNDRAVFHLPDSNDALLLSFDNRDPHIRTSVLDDVPLNERVPLGLLSFEEHRAMLPNEPLRLAKAEAARLEVEAQQKAKAAVDARRIADEMEAASTCRTGETP